ncbi:MAG TPA: UDP-3-O-acyl-N-acetylglucosamine deacetylase [Candidatus Baltobacteraceae bacterium]|nr:UDP-3-O-acyl-N-acetylglucosamine deacetylase [Candidatus Baltobacteraceae bacterium]
MTNAATLTAPLRFEGVGLHTGAAASMEIHPAAPGAGIAFAAGAVRIPALVDYASESPLATVIGRNGTTISTTEHVLSALLAQGVSDAEIVLDGPEVPILDGSALPYVEALERIGLRESDVPRPLFAPHEVFEFREDDKAVIILPSSAFRVRFVGDYPPPIGTHYVDVTVTPAVYRNEIAAARTFAFLRDVEAMRAQGLARGGSLENALVYDDEGPMQPLQWPDEVVRHKVLDLIGDFALLGAWPQCEVIAIKSGHAMHARVIRELRNRG